MAQYFYRHSGIVVRSALELPEWHAFAAAEEDCGEPDVTIRFDEGLQQGAPPDHFPVVEGDSLRFSSPDVGTWRITGGTEIAIQPYAARDSIEVRLFTLGSAWGTLGYQRSWAMLHGSCVLGAKGAVMFCGPQGAGKSTMAAAMAERGVPLVGDDLSRVVPGRADKPTTLYPSSTRHKLWREAIGQLGMESRDQVQDYFRADKYHLEASAHVPPDVAVPLTAIYALEFGETLAITTLTGGDAARSVLSETIYRPRFLEAMGRLPEQAVYAARIAASVPVFRLTRPRELTRLDEVCELVTDHNSKL